jgi:tRNA threonylcarbamoyladenosine biosynthesis protein TsaB
MNLLSLEFSTSARSVAILEQRERSRRLLTFITDSDFRKTSGMKLIQRALQSAHLQPADIGKIAVGLGPGSYTGIRSAIAIAQGWQLARTLELLGISSMEVLAMDAAKTLDSAEITLAIDAQRHELYTARYDLASTPPRCVQALALTPAAALPQSGIIAGPEASKWRASALNLLPRADTLAELAAEVPAHLPGEKLEPIYLREITFTKALPTRSL